MNEQKYFHWIEKLTIAQQLWVVCGMAFLIRLIFSYIAFGYLFVDEIPQYLNVAQYKAFGQGVMTWEWVLHIRSWIVPTLLSYILNFTHVMGLDDPFERLMAIRIVMSLWSVPMIMSMYFIVKILYPENSKAPFFAASIGALWGYLIYFNLRTLGECLSLPAIMISLWWLLHFEKSKKTFWSFLSGVMIGIAFIIKFQAGVFIFSSNLYLIFKRHWKGLILLNMGFLVMVGVQGFNDWVETGSFLGSPIAYFKYNIIYAKQGVVPEGKLQRIVDFLMKMHFPVLFPFIIYFSLRSARRHLLLIMSVICYVGIHMMIKNRQFRFFAPVLPIFLTMFSAAFLEWVRRPLPSLIHQRISSVVWVILCVAMSTQFLSWYFPSVFRPQWNKGGDVCLGLMFVGRQSDSTGVLSMTGSDPFYFYLGKNIPYLPNEQAEKAPERADYGEYNYLLFNTESKKRNPITFEHLHPKLIEDFGLTGPPLKVFGTLHIYRRVVRGK